MKLFIPPLGTRIRLTADWTFEVNPATDYEFRLWADGSRDEDHSTMEQWKAWKAKVIHATIPAGTVLSIERIYVRKGQGDYDSVTFRAFQSPDSTLASKRAGGQRKGNNFRFFSTLTDANRIECEIVTA